MNKILTVSAYIASVVIVNFAFSYLPIINVAGAMVPSTAFLVGIVFVFRDFAQRQIGHHVLVAMLAACVISYFLADPAVAIASLVAFAVSETADWAVYSFTKRPFHQRILLSSFISTPIDTAVFLGLIGFFSVQAVLLVSLAKLVAAVVVYLGYTLRPPATIGHAS